MPETRWASRGEKGLALTLGLLVSLGSPARALAQAPAATGSSSWSFPDESAPAAKPPAQSPAPQPSAQAPTPPPPAQPAAPAPADPRFPVTVNAGATSVSIRGLGIDKPLTCSGTCALMLNEGTYWFDIQTSGRNYSVPVTVTEPEQVVIEKPNAGIRGLGIAGIIVGGSILSIAGFVSYSTIVNCQPGAPQEGTSQCNTGKDQLPFWLTAAGVGMVVSAIGIVVVITNNKPTVEIQPAVVSRARRAPETIIGLGPVRGSTLPGLSLQTSF
jgi:hypothetical protein